ncbi:uncharacterized protein MONOS_9029 [Monocercomonoides exilis]|uniref:uncharacterized protein n=1 Tax=Monocercomonoides exilis TaxID=2049356 RepID=UPI00355A6094|nr:hypothetical protein MONOS_9029 [Monocercomonoides exilis]|eukprot:MONOS_9029.1-p1 / transcript=MONOS_9029.1 / gene=MONOS_9029 / organism=Monocercomonoides_exilis_PA203 / gene_product=unspecified product / transcript_product=unspecified product / location=Mono_scaffold00358:56189-56446(-) / protein_length=86 / sequence_SO=supercontig / SO=protein_coding / is_pseudo=false
MQIVVPEASRVYSNQKNQFPWSLQTLQGYIVTLSTMVSVLLMETLPSLAESAGTKSWCKRIFATVDVTAFPSINDLHNPSLQIWR